MNNTSWQWSGVVGLALVLTSGCGTISREEFDAKVQEARACAEGDTCVEAGKGRCTCGRPVNASRAADINEAAQYVDCVYKDLDCGAYGYMHCVQGKCTGTLH